MEKKRFGWDIVFVLSSCLLEVIVTELVLLLLLLTAKSISWLLSSSLLLFEGSMFLLTAKSNVLTLDKSFKLSCNFVLSDDNEVSISTQESRKDESSGINDDEEELILHRFGVDVEIAAADELFLVELDKTSHILFFVSKPVLL